MKFCPLVPEICRGQVHGPRKEIQLCGKGGQSHILRGSNGVGVTIESYGKVEISYINVDNF
jgi:hypothetical protein